MGYEASLTLNFLRIIVIIIVLIIICSVCYSNDIFVNQVVMEENKEADTTTGQATHRITRGIHDKVCISDCSKYAPLL